MRLKKKRPENQFLRPLFVGGWLFGFFGLETNLFLVNIQFAGLRSCCGWQHVDQLKIMCLIRYFFS